MDENKRKIILYITAVLVVVAFIFTSITSTYHKNNEEMEYLASNDVHLSKTNDENIQDLTKVLDMRLIDPEIKLRAMTMLSISHYLKQEYAPMIQTAIQAEYLAEKENNPYYAAWNYINMSEIFMLMYEHEMAEELIEKALSYNIEDEENQKWIRETAYIYLADLKAKAGEKGEAFKYLTESMKYADETDYDYTDMLLKRNAIKAELAFKEGDYLYAKSLLDEFENDQPEDMILMESVYFPVEEIYAKILVASGEIEEGKRICDVILQKEEENGYQSRRLSFLIELSKLFKDVHHGAYVEYSDMALEAYDDVMRQNAQVMSKYIFTIYSEEYINNEEADKRNSYIMLAMIAAVLILLLSWLLMKSRRKSLVDPLTNLYNRRYFDKVYKAYIRKMTKLGVIMLDIDHFKQVNDTYGHEFGDKVLKTISKVFNAEKPHHSKLFRMGGEEFCVLYKCESLEDAVNAAEHLRIAVENLVWEHGNTVTVSGGVAFAEPNEELYSLADQQLYVSKNNGRNQINYIKAGGK